MGGTENQSRSTTISSLPFHDYLENVTKTKNPSLWVMESAAQLSCVFPDLTFHDPRALDTDSLVSCKMEPLTVRTWQGV